MNSITVPISAGKFTLIDTDDYEHVTAFKWTAKRNGSRWYAHRRVLGANGRYQHISLHRFLLDAPPGLEVDHINGDGLDNRRANLRLGTKMQNLGNQGLRSSNTSGYKGVYPIGNHWGAKLVRQYLGFFDTAELAARAYDTAARLRYGEFARLNFPNDTIAVTPRVGAPKRLGSTGYRGVSIKNRPGRQTRWVARIHDGTQRVLIGAFKTPEDAARAYDLKAYELFGDSAHLNFPDNH